MVGNRQSLPSWMSAAASRVDFESEKMFNGGKTEDSVKTTTTSKTTTRTTSVTDANLGFGERAFSAAGAAVLSAILVNPLDVAKIRLQAQAAGVPYQGVCRMASFETNTMLPDLRGSQSCMRGPTGSEAMCSADCFRYKGTIDVFCKVIQQEGFTRLWRGTNASLALAVPTVGIYLPCYDMFRNFMEDFTRQNSPNLTPYVPLVAGSVARSLACITCYPVELARTRMQAFKEIQKGVKLPGVWKTLLGVITKARSTNNLKNYFDGFQFVLSIVKGFVTVHNYRVLWTGLGAQLARDVPFSAICWSTLEPIRRRILALVGDEARVVSILGANFSAGFVAGSVAAAATCPLDVAKTRRQIENDPSRASKMTTRQTLLEIWRGGGVRGLFTGIGPRVGRAGPSVGIVVSFYEVVKYALHQTPTQ